MLIPTYFWHTISVMVMTTYGGVGRHTMDRKGLFITLEGIDGCGKSTQAKLLIDAIEGAGREVVHLRDPGSARLSEKIRLVLLDPRNDDMCDECELMLYEAARAQMVRELVIPSLKHGSVVLCDRYSDSTFAYQAGGRGLSEEMIRSANKIGTCGLMPDATLLFDIDPSKALGRATQQGADRLEAAGFAFQRRVRDAYLRLAEEEKPRMRVVDATGSVEVVSLRAKQALADILSL